MNVHHQDILTLPGKPWLLRFQGTTSELTDALWHLQSAELSRGVVRFLRGKRMQTTVELFAECAAALQFPYYFGENWNALDECLADLSWLPAAAYVLAITDSADLLVRETPGEMRVLCDVLERTCVAWSAPIAQGEPWDRPAKAFHILLHATVEDTARLSTPIVSIRDAMEFAPSPTTRPVLSS